MATAYKAAQVQGTSSTGTYATLYSTSGVSAVVSSIVICNTSASSCTYRIGLDTTAGTPASANGEWIVYDATIAGNDTVSLTLGLTLQDSRFIRVSSSATDVNFTASVAEIS